MIGDSKIEFLLSLMSKFLSSPRPRIQWQPKNIGNCSDFRPPRIDSRHFIVDFQSIYASFTITYVYPKQYRDILYDKNNLLTH